ncbi:HD domain-containing protein [Pendulispora albinea]|uniref:HD domain-containing protein n=1 Tax=Pendulispora albinea TaxID=2741071 RepID=A0ABZ2M1A7_9BACT
MTTTQSAVRSLPRLPKELAGVRIPDSRLAVEATELVWECSEELLFNHCVRTYVFGGLAAQKLGIAHDVELFYVAAMLHDLGLTARFTGPERFEVDGANAARAFLLERGASERTAALIWDAIALHTSVGIAHLKEPEVALVHLGAGLDVVGSPGNPATVTVRDFPEKTMSDILETLPRLGLIKGLPALFAKILEKKPHTAYFNMMADVARKHVPGFHEPTLTEVMAASGYAD